MYLSYISERIKSRNTCSLVFFALSEGQGETVQGGQVAVSLGRQALRNAGHHLDVIEAPVHKGRRSLGQGLLQGGNTQLLCQSEVLQKISVSDPDPDKFWSAGSGSRRVKMTHKKRKSEEFYV
jgi:hypothetical protein